MKLLTDRKHSAELCAWAAKRIPHVGDAGFGEAWGVGISVSPNEVAAVAVFHDWQPACATVQLSIASDNPRWASRGAIWRVLGLAFDLPWQGKPIYKLWTAMPSDAERVLRFNAACGFKREATLRHHFGPKRHAIVTSITRHEYNHRLRSKGGRVAAAVAA